MIQNGLIASAHTDIVTDAQYDFYGLHLATCGVDQRIKIWHQDESQNQWLVQDDWKAHDAPITALSWAHPEFGIVLASASIDRTVKVWERRIGGGWTEVATLSHARGAVRCVAFAPSDLGFKLATLATDNTLRIYEGVEGTASTTAPSSTAPPTASSSGTQQQPASVPTISWELNAELDLSAPSFANLAPIPAFASISEAPSRGSLSKIGSSPGSSASLSAMDRPDSGVVLGNGGIVPGGIEGGWSISWCKDASWGALVAVIAYTSTGAGVGFSTAPRKDDSAGGVRIIHFPPARRPTVAMHLTIPSTQLSSLSWAPLVGRSYHLLATGSKDGRVRIYKLHAPELDADGGWEVGRLKTMGRGAGLRADEGPRDGAEWTSEEVASFDEHGASVSRVEWNLTGTILASSGADGRVRLWKASYSSIWRPMGYVTAEEAETPVPGAGGVAGRESDEEGGQED